MHPLELLVEFLWLKLCQYDNACVNNSPGEYVYWLLTIVKTQVHQRRWVHKYEHINDTLVQYVSCAIPTFIVLYTYVQMLHQLLCTQMNIWYECEP